MRVKNHRGDGDIFRAVTGIWYSQDFARQWFESHRGRYERTRAFLMHSVIVLDGELFVARLDDQGEWSTSQSNHVKLRTIDCLTAETKDPIPENEVVIDVVKSQYFVKYLQLLQRDLNVFVSYLQELDKAGGIVRTAQPANG